MPTPESQEPVEENGGESPEVASSVATALNAITAFNGDVNKAIADIRTAITQSRLTMGQMTMLSTLSLNQIRQERTASIHAVTVEKNLAAAAIGREKSAALAAISAAVASVNAALAAAGVQRRSADSPDLNRPPGSGMSLE